MRWRFQRGLPLHVPEIGRSLHPDLAIRPWLPGCPLDRIVAVFLLVTERVPLAFRLMPPPHILKYKYVAASRKEYGRGVGLRKSFCAVWRSRHQRRIFPFAHRTVHVRIEHSSVSHRNRDMILEVNVIAR